MEAQGADKTALMRDIIYRELQAQTQNNLARILDKRPSKKGKSTHELPEVMKKVDKLLVQSTSSNQDPEHSETNPMDNTDISKCPIADGFSEHHVPSDQSVPTMVELETGKLLPLFSLQVQTLFGWNNRFWG